MVKAGSVVSLDLNPKLPNSKFGIQISSNEPLVASVFSSTLAEGKSDFIWSTAVPALTKFSLATTGIAPQLIFIGAAITAEAQLFFNNGERKKVVISGSEIATLKVPDGVRSVTFTQVGKGIYGAGLVATKSGYGYFPLVAGSVLTKSSVPRSNIRVLSP